MDKNGVAEVIRRFRAATNRLVLLDYDGTLVEYEANPTKALPPEAIIDLLLKLAGKPSVDVVIVSGRSCKDIDYFLGQLPVKIIAEHGGIVKDDGVWRKQIDDKGDWKKSIINILNEISSACPESFVEEKQYSLAWHYRNSESQSGYDYSRKLINLLQQNNFGEKNGLKILDGNKIVEITSKKNGKGNAVNKLLEKDNYDFILSIGDDVTDEEVFELLLFNSNALTIKVGNNHTSAKYVIPGVVDVILLLNKLSK
jgi:trehalose 6-phosphate synthase/phosphatase